MLLPECGAKCVAADISTAQNEFPHATLLPLWKRFACEADNLWTMLEWRMERVKELVGYEPLTPEPMRIRIIMRLMELATTSR